MGCEMIIVSIVAGIGQNGKYVCAIDALFEKTSKHGLCKTSSELLSKGKNEKASENKKLFSLLGRQFFRCLI